MSLIDYDELKCKFCGHIGLFPDGDFDVQCPACGEGCSLSNEEDDKDEE